MIENSPGLWPRACQSTYWIYCIRVLLILGGPRGTLGGVLDKPHLRCGGCESAATPKTPQDALRCNFFELRYPSPLGGIFAAPRLRRGGPESVAAPKTPQDALRCDFFELRYPSPLGGISAAPRLSRPRRYPKTPSSILANQFPTRPTDPFESQYGPAECAKRLNK